MNRKLLFCCFCIAFIVALAVSVSAAPEIDRLQASKVEGFRGSLQLDATRAACLMNKANLAPAGIGFYPSFAYGDAVMTYFDPTDPVSGGCADATPYPFEINSFTFALWNMDDVGISANYPVVLDIVIYATAGGDACSGPGNELCRYTITADNTFDIDNGGNTVTLSPTCCVDGPFFIGVEYNDAGSGPFPSVVFDDTPAPATCDNWVYYTAVPGWYEWYTFWATPVPGYPLYAVGGETRSPNCDGLIWKPGDPYKMHYPQLPDESGWDVNATYPQILADDWQCSESGYIKDLHFWGSWLNGTEGVIDHFIISFHEDIPVDPADPLSYSHPGATLLEFDVYDFLATPIDPATLEGWYDPATEQTLFDNHQAYFQYDMYFTDPALWLYQEVGTIYWVNISAVLSTSGDPNAVWGWKSTRDHFNDDAVWSFSPDLSWVDIWEPAQPISNTFTAQQIPGTQLTGTGEGAYGDQWWLYPTGWWNVWFYDHPLDKTRKKDFYITVNVAQADPTTPLDLIFAINWSTDQWTSSTEPPLPGTDEDLYIQRQIFELQPGFNEIYFSVLEYNPEWVSIDVQGTNFLIDGVINHTCRGSLDLSFVVTGDPGTGEPTGACCYQDAATAEVLCQVVTAAECTNLGGTYMGDGTTCSGSVEACCLADGSCVMADAFCCENSLGGTPQGAGTQCTAREACCLPDGTCAMIDPLCCQGLGGVPQGAGTQCTAAEACCLPDGSCAMLDPLCCEDLGGTPEGAGTQCSTIPEACCLPDGSCKMLDPLCCEDIGGTPEGPGTQCSAALEACCIPGADCQMLDPLCCEDMGGTPQGPGTTCTTPEACCLPDGTCQMLDPLCCDDLGGTPQGAGTDCATTVCQQPDFKWQQLPDLEQTGMDVNASTSSVGPVILADDYQCTVTGPLTQLKVWGSWYHDLFPSSPTGPPDPGNAAFTISLHKDIPAKDPIGFPIPCPWFPATGEKMIITEGLPSGSSIEVYPVFSNPVCDAGRCALPTDPDRCDVPGGSSGGTHYCDIELVQMTLVGTGDLAGFSRTLAAQAEFEVDLGPQDESASTRNIPTEMISMNLSIFGDPDFDFMSISGGSGNGMPSPGHTTLTRLGPPGSDFQVDSFFDVEYRIEFQGAPGGVLDGMSGATTGVVRMEQKDPDEVSPCLVKPYKLEYSRPGDVLCYYRFDPGTYEYLLYQGNLLEGWYDPSVEFYDPDGDTQCWEYIFPLNSVDPNCFLQEGTVDNPVVYWIDVHADPLEPDFFFGWKTARTHWNDDAVWGLGSEPFLGPWNEMLYPLNHPYFGESVDLAFELVGEGQICDCVPGEADGQPGINILDIVYLINFKYKGGPPPGPYAICSGDANCDCKVDILDIVLLINYKYKNGPAPCSCQDWLNACGGPLMK